MSMRVVSLACSNTEIVCALGCAELLVAVDDHSDYPPKVVSRLPRVGPDLQIDIEAVAAQRPDLVLASLTVPGHERVVAGLESAGLEYVAPEPNCLEDVLRDIREIAQLLQVAERGDALVAQMRQRLGAPAERVTPPCLLVQWWPKPVIAPGRRSWIHDLLALAGATHPLSAEAVKSRPMSLDEVVEANPDAIVLSWCGVPEDKVRPEVLYRQDAWKELAAVRRRRVFAVPEAITGRPSPRLVEGYGALRRIADQVAARE